MKAAKVTALAVIGAWLFYSIPLIKMLVWLNAGAISSRCQSPGLFVPIAAMEVLVILAAWWAVFWCSYPYWKEIKRVRKVH